LIDIYTPCYWASAAVQELQIGKNSLSRFQFATEGCRMLDTWWSDDVDASTQLLRCYSPADLVTLTNGTGSSLTNWVPGAAMDYEKAIYHEKVPLEKAMIFLSVFKKD
jgi:hypothetical protein